MNGESKYFDIDGNECGLYTLVKKEPEWAANRISVLESALAAKDAELDNTRAAVELLAKQIAAAGPGHVGCRLCGYHTSDGWCFVDMRYQCERQIKAWAMVKAIREKEEANE